MADAVAGLKKRVDVAAGRVPPDLVIKNVNVVDVYSGEVIDGTCIAVVDGVIAGVGDYSGPVEVDGEDAYALPGLIDSHIHIESSYVSPEEISRLLVPCGTSTIVADPHEIVNVCGLAGLHYMMDAANNAALDIQFMLPSCVPATPFENSGAVLDAAATAKALLDERVLGLGEFMDYPGVVNGNEACLAKLAAAHAAGKPVDGHSPGLVGKDLSAYAAAGIHTDHECSTVEEMRERIRRGMYVLMRQGSACENLRALAKGVTEQNARRCLLCSDDRQPKTIFEDGHINGLLRICVEEGIDAIAAVRMATLNAAECFGLSDRGGIAPGLRADITLVKDLQQFEARRVWLAGKEAARDGAYLHEVVKVDAAAVKGSMNVKDFAVSRLSIRPKSSRVHVIDIIPGGVVTGKGVATVKLDENGEFLYDSADDIAKIAVIERHHGTGNVGLGFLRGYGIRQGAVALSIAHDSHNIITVGKNDADIAFAVEALIRQGGGIVLANGGEVVAAMPMPLGGIMSEESGEWVDARLTAIHKAAAEVLGISGGVEPVMTLCFMSLPVIPDLKITDMGIFDVCKFEFIPLEAE